MSKKSMLISEIEKATKQFKQTHKVTVSGPFNDEEMPKWFKKWYENEYQNVQPKWFKDWHEKEFKPLVKRVDNLVVKNNLKE